MSRKVVPSILITIALVVLQTTVLRRFAIRGVTPDFAMIVLLFLAHRNGSICGQITGFTSGLVEDFFSIAPLGFHTLIKTVLGYLYGNTAGRMFVDPILAPCLFAVIATVLKALLAGAAAFMFSIELGSESLFSIPFLIELGMNTVLAPFLYAFTGFLKFLYPHHRGAER
jgi:rod shape-determining protein MreD